MSVNIEENESSKVRVVGSIFYQSHAQDGASLTLVDLTFNNESEAKDFINSQNYGTSLQNKLIIIPKLNK